MLENIMLGIKFFLFIIVLFGVSLFLSFFLIPFTYFYGDERIEDIKPQQNELKEKICNSLKYTVRIIYFFYLFYYLALFYNFLFDFNFIRIVF